MNLDSEAEFANKIISGELDGYNPDDVASHIIDVICFVEELAERLEELEEIHKDDKGHWCWSGSGEKI